MIPSIVRTGFTQLRRDRGALLMSFALPIGFFSIFAMIFGGSHNGISRVNVIVVDEDHSATSQRLLKGLLREPELAAVTHPNQKKGETRPADYDAASAEAAVKQGDASAAVIIPKGFGENPVAFGGSARQPEFQVFHDSSDPIAGHLVA
ncbi:MAG: ABC transporter permease, partial [Acidobacteriales bacterium]|nr:ABC transporter permease [Terriglobales bacterium]